MPITNLIGNSQTKEKGDELLVEVCPYCGKNNYHFSINRKKGVYYCFACGAKGHIAGGNYLPPSKPKPYQPENRYFTETAFIYTEEDGKLKEETLKSPLFGFERLIRNEAALEHLINFRRIDYPTIKHFRLGLTREGDLQIPFYNREFKLMGYKYRTLPPARKHFWRTAGSPLCLFGEWLMVASKWKEVYIAEGEFDAMTLLQQGLPAISSPLGAKGWRDEWTKLLEGLKVYVVYDADQAGEEGGQALCDRLKGEGIICQLLKL